MRTMRITEAINVLELNNPILGSDEELVKAFDIAIMALKLLEKIKTHGYMGKEMRFSIGGRRFAVRELAQ